MKKSELKQLIREVIEEVINRNPVYADVKFPSFANLERDGNEVDGVDVLVHGYRDGDFTVFLQEDVLDLGLKNGDNVDDYLTTRTYQRITDELAEELRHISRD